MYCPASSTSRHNKFILLVYVIVANARSLAFGKEFSPDGEDANALTRCIQADDLIRDRYTQWQVYYRYIIVVET